MTAEADLARRVVTELQRQGYTTYEEVSLGYASHRADIVAVRGPVVAVVECKARFTVKLLDQLMRWANGAHLIIGAIGFGRTGPAVEVFCRDHGFGLWSVCGDEVAERVAPKLNRRAFVDSLRRCLREEQRSGEYAQAGSQAGGYFTPFRATCRALDDVVRKNPGIELRAALRLVDHHYASQTSAISSLPDLIRRGLLPGIRCEGKPLRLYIANEASA